MLTLSLLRHAKSDWSDAALADHDRRLSPRGLKAAPAVGAWLAANGGTPDLILCSTAKRAQDTLALVLPHLVPRPTVAFERGLYMADAAALLTRLHELGDEVGGQLGHVMLVGHNPGLQDLALQLARRQTATAREATDRAAILDKLPTAGLVILTFHLAGWRAVRAGSGTLANFVTPSRI